MASARGVSGLRQVIESGWFSAAADLDLDSYYKFSLFEKTNWPRRNDYIHHQEICLLLARLNAQGSARDAADLADKRRFAHRIAAAGLPGIDIIGSYERGAVLTDPTAGRPVEGDLFSKPVDLWCGEGAQRWTATDGAYVDPAGNRRSLGQVSEELRRASGDGAIILQQCATNHPQLLPISGKGLSTCRIVTTKLPGGSAEVALAIYRMPQGDLVADNFAAGGIAAPIDLSTGQLGIGRAKADPATPITIHPNSGHAFVGMELPLWPEALDLALKAHGEFADMASVGWDIAITSGGPVLVEGNGVWCVDLAQIAHQRQLADTAIPACLLAHFRASGLAQI